MSTRRKAPVHDPAQAANELVLRDRQKRINQKVQAETLATDLGLDLKEPEPEAATAAEFLSEEWDRKTFGDPIPTYSRKLYGPDPLLTANPQMKLTIETIGLEEYANATYEAIMIHEENALPDVMMRKGIRAAITKFGKEQVAEALRNRVMQIPVRTVEIEADRNDAMIYSKPMEEAVAKYGTPGMAQKFLSDRCIGQLGLRGYTIVKDERGDPVKVGTLLMGEIPIRVAEARRRHYCEEAEKQVADLEEDYSARAERDIRSYGKEGVSVLQRGDRVRSNAAGDLEDPDLTSSYLGRSRETGFTTERQR